jgi:hypothetical protein
LLELVPNPTLPSDPKSVYDNSFDVLRGAIDLETALLYNGDFEGVLATTGYEWIFDGRQEGLDRYRRVIPEECV